jgi:hypothetical protein
MGITTLQAWNVKKHKESSVVIKMVEAAARRSNDDDNENTAKTSLVQALYAHVSTLLFLVDLIIPIIMYGV